VLVHKIKPDSDLGARGNHLLQPRHQHSPMGKTIAGCYSPIPHEGATSGQNLSGGSG